MNYRINGLHHVTATVAGAQEDLDFYTKLLGLRLVKKTVNFDNPSVYHFYYGDAHGTPGTIMTTFPYKGKGVRTGVKGAGQVTVTSFSVPGGALGFWRDRLKQQGVSFQEAGHRLGEEAITFEDPSGLVLELIAADQDDRSPWHADGIEAAHALRGVHSVTLTVREALPTRRLLQDVLGLEPLGEEGSRTRFGVSGGGAGKVLDIVQAPDAPAAVNGIGTVHHVALAISTEAEQLVVQEQLRHLGSPVTEVRDRQYFRSIYFREPGGVLIEVATEGPGFLVDEEEQNLGHGLKLPLWEEPRRVAIAASLPPVHL